MEEKSKTLRNCRRPTRDGKKVNNKQNDLLTSNCSARPLLPFGVARN